jgi:type I restriction enzyme S subunit
VTYTLTKLGALLEECKDRIGSVDADGLPLLGVSNKDGLHRSGMPRISDMSRYLRVERDWFAYNPMRINVGSLGWAHCDTLTGVISPDYVVFRCKDAQDALEPQLVYLFLKSRPGLRAINLATAGSVRERLYFDALAKVEIPYIPRHEQRRVVARIEELAATVEEARALRQQAADEAGSVLNSARNCCVESLRRRHTDVRLGDVCTKITDGPHVSPSYVEAGVPFISVRNISEKGIDFTTAKYVSEENHALFSKKAFVERGDVLYTKGGTTGVARRVDTDRQFSIWVHVALLKLRREVALDAYVEHMLNAPSSKAQAAEYTHGSSNKDLGLTRMCNIVFPLPPLAEQRRIVAYLDDLQAKVDALKKLQADTAAELDALLPSILDKAFKGEL